MQTPSMFGAGRAPVRSIPNLMAALTLLLGLARRAVPLEASAVRTVIGHSMSKGIKKMSKIFTGCCLLLPLIILIKL